jgi:hypothetical protein
VLVESVPLQTYQGYGATCDGRVRGNAAARVALYVYIQEIMITRVDGWTGLAEDVFPHCL